MTDDKLKKFIDRNSKKEFTKPVNEWSQILERIEGDSLSFKRYFNPWVLGSLVSVLMVIFIVNVNLIEKSSSGNSTDLSLAGFLEESEEVVYEEDEIVEYSYLALIED